MENQEKNELTHEELENLIGPDIKLNDQEEGIEEYERLQMELLGETDQEKKDALEARLNAIAEKLGLEEVA